MKGFLVLLIAAIAASLSVIYGGFYDVSASGDHSAFERWLLETTMENSVKRHAENIQVPTLDDPTQIERGFQHYQEMCEVCHGAPGKPTTEVAEGLMPRPPELAKDMEQWTSAELFWIVKHGVKMSGMPAWGAAHSEEEIWNIVAFLERLPEMTRAQYSDMEQRIQEVAHGHPSTAEEPAGSAAHSPATTIPDTETNTRPGPVQQPYGSDL